MTLDAQVGPSGEMDRLPGFSLQEYRALMERLLAAGYRFRPVEAMPDEIEGPTVFLRHDVDFHLLRQDEVAMVDADLGIRSTFFVLLGGHYNPLGEENRSVIDRIVDLGHEVGLHYDLRAYPESTEATRSRLEWEVEILEGIAGTRVRSICMHEPSAGHGDTLREVEDFVHPHASRFARDLVYLSDSCRAWRDDAILRLSEDPLHDRVLLNLHGELWLDGSVSDRLDYLERVSMPLACEPARQYFAEYLPPIWRTHPAVLMHEARSGDTDD